MRVDVTGRLWRLGDNIDTDVLFPSRYVTLAGASKQATLEGLATLDPELANLGAGDALIAGRNFGCGSSREYAVSALLDLGVRLVVASSYARIFFRNAMNLGLPALEYPGAEPLPAQGPLTADLRTGLISHPPSGRTYQARPIPGFLAEMVERGGLMAHLRATLAAAPTDEH